MAIHTIQQKVFHFTFGPHEPQAYINDGDTVIGQTRDAMGFDSERNPLPEHKKNKLQGTTLNESNPVLGPIYIEEAKVGDLMAVHIKRIRLTRNFALSKQSGLFGSLTGEGPGKYLLYNDPIPEIWYEWKLDLEENTGTLKLPKSRANQAEVPLAPFIGSIGLAPRYGRIETTLTPGEFGGNMDYMELQEGATLYLPVWVDGGFLAFGDIHALQGDGEVNGTALEVTAEVTLTIEVKKGGKTAKHQPQWPRLETHSHIMVLGSARPLMDCVRISQLELLHWLVDDFDFQREEAWQLMAQVSSMRIGNVVDPLYTVAARFPKKYLP